MRAVLGIVAVVLVAPPAIARQSQEEVARAAGREASRLLFAGDADGLTRRLSPSFVAALKGDEGVRQFVATVTAQAGTEQQLLEENIFVEAGVASYYRRSRFTKVPDITIRWVIDPDGVIHGGSVRPTASPAASTHLDYRDHATYRLPFAAPGEGSWYVAWGGRDAIHNYHVEATDQRFAHDLVVFKGSSPFRTDGKTNADHYCFGEPILAPAAGRVTAAVDGIPDNAAPGIQNRAQPAGNHVIIDHGNGEFSILAHFREGSVAVEAGQAVRPGELLGRCGNSGKSTLPHLHYHLQTTGVFGQGEGLPVTFTGYTADGVRVPEGEIVRGQRVAP